MTTTPLDPAPGEEFQTLPVVIREGLTEDETDLAFLRDVAELSLPSELHHDGATALVRAFTAAGEWLAVDDIVEAAEILLGDLSYSVDWMYEHGSLTNTGYTIRTEARL
jgi:hypothetical protein